LNQLSSKAIRLVLLGVLFSVCACAKKEPKPLRTKPWLAHPTARATGSVMSDAALPATRYALTEQSLIRFEIPSKRGVLRGTLTRVSGELSVVLSDLSQTRGEVRADLGSLGLQGPDANDSSLLTRARGALDLGGPGAAPSATFAVNELRDLSPAELEPAPQSHAGTPFTRRARLTAVGNLLLHGFRVVRRAPLEVEFGFVGDRSTPSTLLIRSGAPFVVSLETHAVRVLRPESQRKPKTGASSTLDEVRVSVELYARKVE